MKVPTNAQGLVLILLVTLQLLNSGCSVSTSSKRGVKAAMQTYAIGRFRIEIPTAMHQKLRSAKLGYVEIEEVSWPQSLSNEKARLAEWEKFFGNITNSSTHNNNIIATYPPPTSGKWLRGVFYHPKNHSSRIGIWTMLLDAGSNGVWLRGEPSIVEKEIASHMMAKNIEGIALTYQPFDTTSVAYGVNDTRFFLERGAINQPYLEQEESVVRFEGENLGSLIIEMYMDFTDKIENTSLIDGTKAMITASLLIPGGSITKIRLCRREVAGMPGEEAILRVREGETKNLVFTWRYNGKDDSGEYPTTRIEMESPDGNLDEKLQIWDAILDSMKPMFERKS